MPSAGNLADVPKAEADCFRHCVQWQWYSARGSDWGVSKSTLPHWQTTLMLDVVVVVVVVVNVVDVDGEDR